MAVANEGTGTLNQSSGTSGAFALSGAGVPAAADLILVTVAGSAGATMMSTLYWDTGSGQEFTLAKAATWAGTNYCETYWMKADDPNWPGTGASTLNWTTASNAEGFNFYVSYWSGVDQTTPIGDTDDAGGSTNGWTSALSPAPGAGDMAFGMAYHAGGGADINPGASGQTALTEDSTFNYCSVNVGYKLNDASFEMTGANLVPAAFVINAASTGTSIPVFMNHYSRMMRG